MMAVPPPFSVCAVAEIIGKQDGLTRVRSISFKRNIDTVLVEKKTTVQTSCRALRPHPTTPGAKFYAAPFSSVVLPYSATNRKTVFRSTNGLVAPVWR
jgi:hypothetical protein